MLVVVQLLLATAKKRECIERLRGSKVVWSGDIYSLRQHRTWDVGGGAAIEPVVERRRDVLLGGRSRQFMSLPSVAVSLPILRQATVSNTASLPTRVTKEAVTTGAK